jgi:cell division protease FtsH
MLCIGLVLAFTMMDMGGQPRDSEVSISAFIDRVAAGEITQVVIQGDAVQGRTADGTRVSTYATDKTELIRVMREKNVSYEERPPQQSNATWVMMLLKIALPLGLLLVIFMAIRRATTGQMQGAQRHAASKATLHANVATTFADVAGCDEAVEEVRDLVAFLKDPRKFERLGGRVPKGVLLMGPSGTGKTLLARAVAGEAGVPFYETSAAGFVEMFVGVGAARVRDLFAEAKKKAPCIIFIDELDAVGQKRMGLAGFTGGHDERTQTLNQLLVEMDGFVQNQGVIVIGATNVPEVLDQALLRPGRFDRKVVVPRPDLKGREAILRVHARNKKMAADVDFGIVARGTPGMTGADLEELLNEAALEATKKGKEAIDTVDIEYARDKVFMGPERKGAVMSAATKDVIARHEVGHTIVGWFEPNADPIRRVTIIPRGMALGLTWSLPEEDRQLHHRDHLIAQVRTLLGGRAAEAQKFGANVTTGAANDLTRATDIVRKMVTEWGMSEKLGLMVLGKKNQGFMYEQSQQDCSDDMARRVDDEIKGIIDREYAWVSALLDQKKDLLERLTAALREVETLEEVQIAAILGPQLARS